jgi:hypothetical protein
MVTMHQIATGVKRCAMVLTFGGTSESGARMPAVPQLAYGLFVVRRFLHKTNF